MFSEISIPKWVNTSVSSAVDVFFSPALKQASTYNVAVAYFSSRWISDAAPGLSNFVSRGGKLKWIVSPELSSEDLAAIKSASSREEKVEIVWEHAQSLLSSMEKEPRSVLSWLIADRILDIRFALPRPGFGMFHAKIGFMEDEAGEVIAFSGSYNQTSAANRNWERIDVFSLEGEPERTNKILDEWEALWQGTDEGCEVVAVSDTLIEIFKKSLPGSRPYSIRKKAISTPKSIRLRGYQQEAVDSWFKNKGVGMFFMATGTGKTITALSLMENLSSRILAEGGRVLMVVAVPYKHLLDQWCSESEQFGFHPIKCYEGKATWLPLVRDLLSDLRLGVVRSGLLTVTYSTLKSTDFQSLVHECGVPTLFVGDEVHNVVEGRARDALPSSAQFRLGLTATPEREVGSDDATGALAEYFGNPIFEYGIELAIENGYLTAYRYIPIRTELTSAEFDEYVEISESIGQLYGRKSGSADEQLTKGLDALLMKRARLLGDADRKYEELRRLLINSKRESKSLIYCGDYSDDAIKPVSKVTKMCSDLNIFSRKFTHVESSRERRQIISELSSGAISTVVAIRCLDEGVDIPSVDTAYMLSSSVNLRQFIQRRGRVLRLSPGKTVATIYDFICVPPSIEMMASEKKAAKSMLSRELARVREFSRLSVNYHQCRKLMEGLESEVTEYAAKRY